uniref:MMS19 nucleotide excision repair protein n=4 Tax=Clastoptera arizonana TaxID=38151 RepID=A0A1B6CXX0_9HEMI
MDAVTRNNNVCKMLMENKDLKESCSKISEGIVDQKKSIVSLIEDLEPLLVNTNLSKRKIGVEAIVNVLQTLPATFLSEEQISYICQFLCDRIKDHHSLTTAVLDGICAIVKMKCVSAQTICTLCSTMFNNIICQAQQISDRHTYYTILQVLLSQHLQDLKLISNDFVIGLVTAMDGERNPENLLLLFSFLPVFLKTFQLGQFREDTFETIACYFPVDFNPPENVKSLITREDLSSALINCLTAIPEFAEFCLPLLLEKLDSNLKVAKHDSFRLLIDAVKVWKSEIYLRRNLTELWLVHKKEMLVPIVQRDEYIYQIATSSLIALLQCLNDDDLVEMVDWILGSCEGLLSDVNFNLFSPAANILLTTAKATEKSCTIVVPKVFSSLLFILEHSTNPIDQVVLLNSISSFVDVCLAQSIFLCEGYLDKQLESWPVLLLQLVNNINPEVRTVVFKEMASLVPYLPSSLRHQLYPMIISSVESENSISVRNSCMKCLKILTLKYPAEVEEKVVKTFKTDNILSTKTDDIIIQEHKFEGMCFIAVNEDFSKKFKSQLLSIVNLRSTLTLSCLRCLRKLLEDPDSHLDEYLLKFISVNTWLISALVSLWIESAKEPDTNAIFTDTENLIEITKIIDFCVQQFCSMDVLFNNIKESHLKIINYLFDESEEHSRYFMVSSKCHQTQVVLLLESLVGSLRAEVQPISLLRLETILLPLAIHSTHQITHISTVRLIATVINKIEENGISAALNVIFKNIESSLISKCEEEKERALMLITYITKSLALRGHPDMDTWLERQIQMLGDNSLGALAAEGFQILMEEPKLYLSSKSNCTVMSFYRQRIFQKIPLIVENYHKSSPSTKINYLNTVMHLIQNVPTVVLVFRLVLLMPLLVASFEMADSVQVLLPTLQSVGSLLKIKEPIFEQYIDTFINKFLIIAKTNQNMKIRIAALQCLNYYLGYSHIRLMPLKQQVILDLVSCLDDKKRLVRKEAVKTRSNWFLLGSPVGET